jgi:hypothetical protein
MARRGITRVSARTLRRAHAAGKAGERVRSSEGSPEWNFRTLVSVRLCIDDLPLPAYRGYLHALAASRHLFHSAEMIGPGGLAARLVTTALAGDLGVRLHPLPGPPLPALFAEHRCAALVEIDEAHLDRLPAELEPLVVGRLLPARGIHPPTPAGRPRAGRPRAGLPRAGRAGRSWAADRGVPGMLRWRLREWSRPGRGAGHRRVLLNMVHLFICARFARKTAAGERRLLRTPGRPA